MEKEEHSEQEWTVKKVKQLWYSNITWQNIADAIKQQELWHTLQLRSQLAAEQDKVKRLENDLRRMQGITTDKRVEQLRSQLADERDAGYEECRKLWNAERLNVQWWKDEYVKVKNESPQLRSQLAAAVTFAESVRDSYEMLTHTDAILKAHRKNIDNAYTFLAKIKEGKK